MPLTALRITTLILERCNDGWASNINTRQRASSISAHNIRFQIQGLITIARYYITLMRGNEPDGTAKLADG
jgi:hypothetical protein